MKRRTKKRQRGKRTGIKFLSSLAIVLTTISAFPLFAQLQAPSVGPAGSATSRSIEGTVLGQDGAVVPGAVVLIKDSKTLQVRSYIAQQDGRFHFYGLSTDVNYQLRAQSNGLTSKTKTVSVFDSHARIKLNLKLTKRLK
jgi:hypothetical protein